jgi:hypothetical protein
MRLSFATTARTHLNLPLAAWCGEGNALTVFVLPNLM